jgi:hypothetical protein
VPDFKIQDLKSKRDFFFELFHRWHKDSLHHRIKHLDDHQLIVGADKKLDIKDERLLVFQDFPTAKQIYTALCKKRDLGC